MVLVLYFGIGGVCVFGGLIWGSYNNLFQLGFLLTMVSWGVGGTFCKWYCVICRFSSIVLIVSI